MNDHFSATTVCKDIELQLRREDPVYANEIVPFFDEYNKTHTSSRKNWAAISKSHSTSLISFYENASGSDLDEAILVIQDELHRNRGRPSQLKKFAAKIPPEVIVYLTIRSLVSLLQEPQEKRTAHRAANSIGRAIEQELALKYLHKENYQCFLKIKTARSLKTHAETKAARDKQKARYWALLNRSVKQVSSLNNESRLSIGFKLINIICKYTDLFSINPKHEHGKTKNYVIASQDLLDELSRESSSFSHITTPNLPLICRPVPWDSLYGGGYHTKRPKSFLIKRRGTNRLINEFDKTLTNTDISPVLSAINVLQNTAWKINRELLSIIEIAYLRDQSKFALEKISQKDFRVLDTLSRDGHFFYSYEIDFRGRAYPTGPWINPQGGDVAKSLLSFAKAKPIGDVGARYLAIHGSHLVPSEAISPRRHVTLEERVKWVHDKAHEIYQSAESPLRNRWWIDVSKEKSRYQFLAFCMEWKRYMDIGETSESRIPIAMDGTCNGLQHFSALLKDGDIAKRTNVARNETPSDIYDEVAQLLKTQVEADTEGEYGKYCVNLINRNLCKPIVMNTPYGIGDKEIRKTINTYINKKESRVLLEKNGMKINKGNVKGVTEYLFLQIKEIVKNNISSASKLKRWLKRCAKKVSAQNIPIVWVSPIGLPVLQPYFEQTTKQCRSEIYGKLPIKYNVTVTEDEIDEEKQARRVTPNLVHSLDASHMMRTVNSAHGSGIDCFRMNHDSFATHAADAEKLASILREEFHNIYSKQVLADFYYWLNVPISRKMPDDGDETRAKIAKLVIKWTTQRANKKDLKDITLPPLPSLGDFDLKEVRESPYFFS